MSHTSESKPEKARIFIVDDHPMVRERLAEMINRESDLIVCGEAEDARTAFQAIEHLKPDLAIVDLSLRNTHGIELIKDLRFRGDAVRILVLSMHDESVYAERVLRAGARGYITKQEPSRMVIKAIREILEGRVYVSEKIATRFMQKFAGANMQTLASQLDLLSDRELEVYQLLGQGRASREIAAMLGVDVKSVETYRARIRDKLGLDSTTDLHQHAMRWVLHERGKA